jgi:8-oxo-dGTP pyrophosphatase MutT (NUDIX family)
MYSPDLRERLRRTLDRSQVTEPGRVAPGTRLAAVLLPLIDGPEPSLVFTRRTEDLPRHPGEISFPGGLEHDEDADLVGTALRETEEELGLGGAEVEILGALSPVHTVVSAILIVPFVGSLATRPAFVPNPAEIAEVLEFPVDRLAQVEAEVEWPLGEHVYRGFAYELDGNMIWGATARILHDFLDRLRRLGDES